MLAPLAGSGSGASARDGQVVMHLVVRAGAVAVSVAIAVAVYESYREAKAARTRQLAGAGKAPAGDCAGQPTTATAATTTTAAGGAAPGGTRDVGGDDDRWISLLVDLRTSCSAKNAVRGNISALVVRNGVLLTWGYVRSLLVDASKGKKSRAKVDVHAEADAIATAARNGVALEGATLFCSSICCVNCFRLVVAAGIKRVVRPAPCAPPPHRPPGTHTVRRAPCAVPRTGGRTCFLCSAPSGQTRVRVRPRLTLQGGTPALHPHFLHTHTRTCTRAHAHTHGLAAS